MKLVDWTPVYRDGKYYVQGYNSKEKVCEQVIFASHYTARDILTIHTDENVYLCELDDLVRQIGSEFFEGYKVVEKTMLQGDATFSNDKDFTLTDAEVEYLAKNMVYCIMDEEVLGEEAVQLIKSTGSLDPETEQTVRDYIRISHLSGFRLANIKQEETRVYKVYLDIFK